MLDGETDRLARVLYEAMERLSDDAPGPPWGELPETYKPWYRECVTDLLAAIDRAKA